MGEVFRILVTGSRAWPDAEFIAHELAEYDGGEPAALLVSGACPVGGDAMAEAAAQALGWPIERHPADWGRYGRSAGFRRNAEMVDLGADLCLAFITNSSHGATMTADLAEKAGIPTRRFTASFAIPPWMTPTPNRSPRKAEAVNDERCDRDRVTAILTLADAATGVPMDLNAIIALDRACKNEGLWLARRLLEALDTIDKARELHGPHDMPQDECAACMSPWPCPTWQALNGGNE